MQKIFANSEHLKWVLLVLLSCIWGSSFILIKIGLQGFDYVQAATIRLCAAGFILTPFALQQLKYIPKEKRKYILITSMTAMFVPAYLFCFAQQHISSAVAGIMNSLTPTFTFLISLYFFKTKYSFLQYIGLVLGLAGSIYLSTLSNAGSFGINPYAVVIVIATVFYGININIVKQYLKGVKPWAVSTCSVSFAGWCAFVFAFIPFSNSYQITDQNINSFISLVFLGLLSTALAIIIHNELIHISSALFASSNTYLIPIVAIVWGILDGEQVSNFHLIGVMIIIAAILLIRFQPRRSQQN